MVPPQYHVVKALKSLRYYVVVSARSYIIVMFLLFIIGTLTQVGACPKEIENSPRNPLDVLLGHILRRPARASKPSQKPSPTRV
jgi:hypothetical protein